MAVRASIDWLYSLQTFGIKLGLDNIQTLLDRLGRPDAAMRCVLIAGTNGKGSTAATLAAIASAAGVRTGLYTSPHLHCFSERVRVDGVPIRLEEVDQLVEELRALGEGLPLTFFEFTTALALEHFRRQQVELAVLEVGMGGRLDATNAVHPCLSIITPVDCDHQAWLGDTLDAIAGEKAGILRPDVPAVVARQLPEVARAVQAAADELGTSLICCGRDCACHADVAGSVNYHGLDRQLDGLRPALLGRHQQVNLEAALCAAELLARQGVRLSPEAMRLGVESVRHAGRIEWLAPRMLLDGAHNAAGATALAAYLEEAGIRRVRWVVGIKGDKDYSAILRPLLPLTVAAYCVAPPIEAALAPEILQAAFQTAGTPAACYASPGEAVAAASAACGEDEIVLVAGSLFLVAAVRGGDHPKESVVAL